MLEVLASNNTTIQSLQSNKSGQLDQTMRDIDRFDRDAENRKKENDKLEKEVGAHEKRNSLQCE